MEGVYIEIHVFLTSALGEGEWSDSHPGHFTPGERVPGIHWIGGWVGPRASLGGVEKTFLTLLRLNLQPLGCTASSQSLYRLCCLYMTSLINHREKSTSINLYQKDELVIITNCKALP
jgi:hypothetical protein